MGVMSCSRKECESIMCDTYVDGVGYVCPGCQEEFKEFIKTQNIEDGLSEYELVKYLKKFMETHKHEFSKGPKIDIESFFEMYTKKY